MVRFKDGKTHAVELKTTLKDEFERLLGRNVDVTDERLLPAPLRKTVERDAVSLYG
jgi:predicted nucleotidyltransferase